MKQKISVLYSLGFLLSFNILLSMVAHVLSKFDRRPVGGSIVILIDVYRIETGKAALGMDVSQMRHSSWSFSESCSTIASSLGIHETDK